MTQEPMSVPKLSAELAKHVPEVYREATGILVCCKCGWKSEPQKTDWREEEKPVSFETWTEHCANTLLASQTTVVSEAQHILKEVCEILGAHLRPGLARYVNLIDKAREAAAAVRAHVPSDAGLREAARNVIEWDAEYRKLNHLGQNPPHVFAVLATELAALTRHGEPETPPRDPNNCEMCGSPMYYTNNGTVRLHTFNGSSECVWIKQRPAEPETPVEALTNQIRRDNMQAHGASGFEAELIFSIITQMVEANLGWTATQLWVIAEDALPLVRAALRGTPATRIEHVLDESVPFTGKHGPLTKIRKPKPEKDASKP